ncbi:hypothetical protein F4823DRAFT_631827 [Ustulina deusta]|nr:hypothetical protein F4823DRAFT_631827 [Ustulina deusta]
MFEDAASIVRGERLPWDKLPNEDASDDDEFYLSTTPNTELGQILRNITDINTCLLGLSISIRNPAPHDRFRALNSSDAGHYEPYDIEHVQAKFPNIDREISERLGKAISRRRQYFKYREAHRDALSYGIDSDDSNKTWTIPRSTIASSIPEALKGDEAFDLTLIDDDVVSETGLSRTSYASSTNAPDQLRVPPLPAGAKNGPFECPFCYTIIIARSKSAWQRHVFRDLHPYVCLAKDCETADQDFERLGRTGGGTGNTVITLPDEDSEELEIPSGTPYKST